MTQTIPAKKNFFNQNVDLMNGPIFKSLFIFMLPIFVSNLFQQLYNTVDTMIVGNVLGDTALAASLTFGFDEAAEAVKAAGFSSVEVLTVNGFETQEL